jgi:hypothetical protein
LVASPPHLALMLLAQAFLLAAAVLLYRRALVDPASAPLSMPAAL